MDCNNVDVEAVNKKTSERIKYLAQRKKSTLSERGKTALSTRIARS